VTPHAGRHPYRFPKSRGTSLARLPGCAGGAETVAADLEFVLAAKDQVPPGLMRAASEEWTVSANADFRGG